MVTTHAPPIGGLEARRPFPARLGPKGALVYKLVTTTDHKMIGMGLGSAVLEALVGKETPPLRLVHWAVRIMPGSGTPSELLAAAAIDAASIDSAARHLLDGADRQSDRQDASTPTAQRRSAALT